MSNKVVSGNKNFQALIEVMENPIFRRFYNIYFKGPEEAKTAILFMHLYEFIEERLKIKNPLEKAKIIYEVMNNRETRQNLYKFIEWWINGRSSSDCKQSNCIECYSDPRALSVEKPL